MKIDAVLARHPWPWCSYEDRKNIWFVTDLSYKPVLDCEGMKPDVRDAILELVEAHVARKTTQATHSEECWRWHLDCAVAKVEAMKAKEDKQ